MLEVETIVEGVSRRERSNLEYGATDASHVGTLGNVVTGVAYEPRAPHQHVVCQVAHDVVALLHGRHQHLAQQRDVLMVPGVSISECRAVGDLRDLVAVVPPEVKMSC